MDRTTNRHTRRAKQRKERAKLRALKKRAKKPPLDAESGIKLGDQLAAAREWHDAIHCYRAVVKESNDVQALARLGYVYASAGFTRDAIETYEAALRGDPENTELKINLGTVINAIGRPERALPHFEQVASQIPEDPDCQYMLGETYRMLQQPEKSATHYALAIKLYSPLKLDAAALIKAGRSLAFLQRYDGAINFLQQAVKLAPNMPGAHYELASVYMSLKEEQKAMKSYGRTLELAPNHSGALRAYARLMANRGQLSTTAWAYRRLSQLFPDDASVQHMLAASSQKNVTGFTDEAYVKDTFNHYADGFEAHLVDGLSYRTPENLHELFVRHWNGNRLTILDLGCGTGLCGPLFRDMAGTLVGVDLSKGMLAEAEKKRVYDELKLSELISALEQEYQSQDLLLAADVFVYVGDLDPVFQASQQSLLAGGQLLFSVESMDGSRFKLGPSGRYQHSERYIQTLADKHGFQIRECQSSVLRTEKSMPVQGHLYLLDKTN